VGSIFILVGGSLLLINPFSGLWSYVFITALIGFGCAPIYPNMMFLNNDYFKRNQISRIMSLQMAIGYMGFGLLTPLAGLMFEKISISLYPWLLTMMGLFLLIMVIQYFKNEVISNL
jgi:MFS family permease